MEFLGACLESFVRKVMIGENNIGSRITAKRLTCKDGVLVNAPVAGSMFSIDEV